MPGYVSQPISPEKGFWLSARDYEALEREGTVLVTDLTRCDTGTVVYEVDQDTFKSRPVAVTVNQPVSQVVDSLRKNGCTRAFRPEDIVDLSEICRRTNRTKGVVVGKWKPKPNWPKPILQLGKSEGYYWPDIVRFLRECGMPLYRAEWEKPTRKGDAA